VTMNASNAAPWFKAEAEGDLDEKDNHGKFYVDSNEPATYPKVVNDAVGEY